MTLDEGEAVLVIRDLASGLGVWVMPDGSVATETGLDEHRGIPLAGCYERL